MLSLVFLLVTGQSTPKSLIDQIGIKPTGKNGYEELLTAADILQAGSYRTYYDIDRALTSGAEISTDERTRKAAEVFRGMNSLQRKRWLAERFSKATDLVRQAVKKPIFEPRGSMETSTLFPELAAFRSIGFHLATVAYVERASGRDTASVETTLIGLHCFDRIQRSTMISYLVGRAGSIVLMNGLSESLPQLSHIAAEKLEAGARELANQPNAFYDCLAGEFKWMTGFYKELEKDLSDDTLIAAFGDDESEFKKRLLGLSTADRKNIVPTFKKKMDVQVKRFGDWAAGGPKSWLNPPDFEPQPSGDAVEQLVEEMLANSFPVFAQPALLASINVVQQRLLWVTAAVLRYRWENGRLPAKLADAVEENLTVCPLSDKPLIYSRLTGGGFEIKSEGVPKTGEITLTSRPPRAPAGPEDP